MREFFNKKYFYVDKIPSYRISYIDMRLKYFIELLGLKRTHWPLDCMKLYEKLKAEQLIPFDYTYSRTLPDDLDAVTIYIEEHNVSLITINENLVNYPFERSEDRRLNFTMIHELAHIFLDHMKIPREAKTEEEKDIEEIEANEFTGRLLMPKSMLFSFNFHSQASAALSFNVSNTCLWIRLNNIKRLDLLRSRRINTCSQCGNTSFSIFAEYCGICGAPLTVESLKGTHRISYTSKIKFDKYKSAIACPLCKSTSFKGVKCSKCHTYIFNFCSDYLINFEDGCNTANPSNSRFCEMCGKPTYFFKRGLLKSWQEELEKEEMRV